MGPKRHGEHGDAAPTSAGRLVGRRHERAWLEDAFAQIEGGRPRVLVVGGNAGIGKSRLVHEVVSHRAQGWLTATGHCVEAGESGLPYAPLSGIITAIGGSEPGAELLANVSITAPGLLPLVANGSAAAAHPADTTSGLSQLRLLDAMVRLLAALSRHQPTLIIIEDLHWSDPSTRAFVSFLCRNLTPQRLGLVLTTRTDELHRKHPLRPLLGELTRLPVVERIDLEPLGTDDLGDLMTDMQGARPPRVAVRRIAERSGGNPFFAEQLLAVGADRSYVRAPAELADLLLHRVDQLTGEARYLLEVASLAGQRIDHDVLIAVADRKEREVTTALQEAADARLFEPDESGGSYRFSHALLAEVIAADMLPAERRRLHGRYADFLDARASPAVVAHHRLGAGDRAGAFTSSVDAAREAFAVAGPSDELVHWERVLELWPYADQSAQRSAGSLSEVALAAARAAENSGAVMRAIELARRARETAETPHQRARARLVLAPLLTQVQTWVSSDVEQATAAIEEVGDDRVLAATGRYLLARAHLFASRFAEALPIADAVASEAELLGRDDLALGARATAFLARSEMGETQPEVERELIDAAQSAGDVETGLWVLTKIADWWWPVDAEKGEQIAMQAYDYAIRNGVRANLRGVWARETLTLCRWLDGNWDGIEQLADSDPLATNDATAATVALEVEVDIARGRLAMARRRLEDAQRVSADPLTDAFIAVSMVDLCVAEGDLAVAVAVAVDKLDALPPSTGFVDMETTLVARAMGAIADAHDAGIDLPGQDVILSAAARVEEEHRSSPTPRLTNRPLSYLLAQRSRLTQIDVDLWGRALERCLGHRYEAAERRTHLAQALLEAGHPMGAAQQLRLAAETCRAIGAVLLMRRIEALASRARIPLTAGDPLPDVEERWGLTEREYQVLRLVAEGYTNRQVGEELFISEKTASVHVSNILTKLGAGNRGEAAAIARRNGLLPGRPS